MKNKLLATPLKVWASLAFLLPAMLGGGVNAQIQPPVIPDQYIASSGHATVNTALIECSPSAGGVFLSAIIWGDPSATNLFIESSNGQTVIVPITNAAPSSKPDVILADDHANPGLDYIAVICYQDNNGDIQLENYRISNITGTMIATQIGSYNLGAGSTPKIDGFANNNSLIAGKPEMDKFVMVWSLTTLNDIGVYAAEVNDITLSFYSNTFTNAGLNPDVAAIRNIANNNLYADILCYSPYGPSSVYDINVTTASAPVITNISPNDFPRPRIEGMGLYDPSIKPPKWVVILFNDFNIIRYYTDLNPTNPRTIYLTVPPNPPTIPSYNNYTAAVTAGIGPFSPNPNAPIGNRQYTFAWGAGLTNTTPQTPAILSAACNISYTQVTIPAPCLQVNSIPVGYIPHNNNDYEVGIATSCNSGNRLLSAWWNIAQGAVYYKLTTNNQYQFKPTAIDTTVNKIINFTAFPNPAQNTIWLQHKDLNIKEARILDPLGKVKIKVVNCDLPIDISSLSSGNYFISIQTKDGRRMTQPFTKD